MVIGAGGHAKVVIEAIWAMDGFEIVGVIDPKPENPELLGVPVLGGDEELPKLLIEGVTAAVVAIGANSTRQRIGHTLLAMGFTLPQIRHPSAFISPSATIAQGTVIMAMAIVGTLACVRDLAIINTGAIVEHDSEVGEAAHIAPGVVLAGRVRVGNRALVGAGTVVRPYIIIGNDAVVGAGSAVVANVLAASVVAGTPAKLLKRHNQAS